MLEVRGVSGGYGHLRILNGVDLSARTNGITAIIGPNGAGKSTLLKTICAFLKPSSGAVFFEGEDITRLKPEQILRRGLLFVQQGRSVFPYLTVEENLLMGAYVIEDRRRLREALDRAYVTFPQLKLRRKQLAGSLSGGERRFVELARALMLKPKLVLLDEPSLGVAPRVMKSMYERIGTLNREGIGFLIVEQNVRLALEAADQIHVLELGRTRWSGSPKDLVGTTTLHALYLGGTATGT
jgi:branched-chain amino acid transport system ATP-binding protein